MGCVLPWAVSRTGREPRCHTPEPSVGASSALPWGPGFSFSDCLLLLTRRPSLSGPHSTLHDGAATWCDGWLLPSLHQNVNSITDKERSTAEAQHGLSEGKELIDTYSYQQLRIYKALAALYKRQRWYSDNQCWHLSNSLLSVWHVKPCLPKDPLLVSQTGNPCAEKSGDLSAVTKLALHQAFEPRSSVSWILLPELFAS